MAGWTIASTARLAATEPTPAKRELSTPPILAPSPNPSTTSPTAESVMITFIVATEADLNAAIKAVDQTTTSGTYTIQFAADITEGTDTGAGLPPDLYAINLNSGVQLVIDGQ